MGSLPENSNVSSRRKGDTMSKVHETPSPVLLDVKAVAKLLACSTRHVYRLADGGRMPPPIHLGSLVRWKPEELARWLADGCPKVRKEVRR